MCLRQQQNRLGRFLIGALVQPTIKRGAGQDVVATVTVKEFCSQISGQSQIEVSKLVTVESAQKSDNSTRKN